MDNLNLIVNHFNDLENWNLLFQYDFSLNYKIIFESQLLKSFQAPFQFLFKKIS